MAELAIKGVFPELYLTHHRHTKLVDDFDIYLVAASPKEITKAAMPYFEALSTCGAHYFNVTEAEFAAVLHDVAKGTQPRTNLTNMLYDIAITQAGIGLARFAAYTFKRQSETGTPIGLTIIGGSSYPSFPVITPHIRFDPILDDICRPPFNHTRPDITSFIEEQFADFPEAAVYYSKAAQAAYQNAVTTRQQLMQMKNTPITSSIRVPGVDSIQKEIDDLCVDNFLIVPKRFAR